LSAIQMSQSGYPNRLDYRHFTARFQRALGLTCSSNDNVADLKQDCTLTLQEKFPKLGVDAKDKRFIQFGISKIYFGKGILEKLEEVRARLRDEAVLLLQRTARMHAKQILFRNRQKSVICIQSALRQIVQQRAFEIKAAKVLHIQAYARSKKAAKVVQVVRERKAATIIQNLLRENADRITFLAKKRAILKLQTRFRVITPRKTFKKKLAAKKLELDNQSKEQAWREKQRLENIIREERDAREAQERRIQELEDKLARADAAAPPVQIVVPPIILTSPQEPPSSFNDSRSRDFEFDKEAILAKMRKEIEEENKKMREDEEKKLREQFEVEKQYLLKKADAAEAAVAAAKSQAETEAQLSRSRSTPQEPNNHLHVGAGPNGVTDNSVPTTSPGIEKFKQPLTIINNSKVPQQDPEADNKDETVFRWNQTNSHNIAVALSEHDLTALKVTRSPDISILLSDNSLTEVVWSWEFEINYIGPKSMMWFGITNLPQLVTIASQRMLVLHRNVWSMCIGPNSAEQGHNFEGHSSPHSFNELNVGDRVCIELDIPNSTVRFFVNNYPAGKCKTLPSNNKWFPFVGLDDKTDSVSICWSHKGPHEHARKKSMRMIRKGVSVVRRALTSSSKEKENNKGHTQKGRGSMHEEAPPLIIRSTKSAPSVPAKPPKALHIDLSDVNPQDLRKYRATFKVFDADGDGLVDRYEFAEALKKFKLQNHKEFTQEKCDELFYEIDINGDGRLDFGEFVTWIVTLKRQKNSTGSAMDDIATSSQNGRHFPASNGVATDPGLWTAQQ